MYFQDIIFTLQKFWCDYGCSIIQPIDTEVGAGTSHYATMLRALDKKPTNVVYVQPCRRPADGRYAQNPNRMQHYYQMQVLLKPSPEDIQQQTVNSLKILGVAPDMHDIRFVHSDWENPTLGAWGLGWEIWCDGMEIIQFTYMQQVGGITCQQIPGEITYGLERLAMYIQKKDNAWDLVWNNKGVTYRDIYEEQEVEFCHFNFHKADTEILIKHFADYETMAAKLLEEKLIHPSYDCCLKASHIFNILDARGVISVTERASYIGRVRDLAKACCLEYSQKHGESSMQKTQ